MSLPTETEWEEYYAKVYPHIALTLERLCAKYGCDLVLSIFSSDMPSHRRELKRQEREQERERRHQKKNKERIRRRKKQNPVTEKIESRNGIP